MPLKRSKPAPFQEYALVLRETKPGEFTVVSFSRIGAKPKTGSTAFLRAKETLVRKSVADRLKKKVETLSAHVEEFRAIEEDDAPEVD